MSAESPSLIDRVNTRLRTYRFALAHLEWLKQQRARLAAEERVQVLFSADDASAGHWLTLPTVVLVEYIDTAIEATQRDIVGLEAAASAFLTHEPEGAPA